MLKNAREVIEARRIDYNEVRPHNSLGNLTSSEFIKKLDLSTERTICELAV